MKTFPFGLRPLCIRLSVVPAAGMLVAILGGGLGAHAQDRVPRAVPVDPATAAAGGFEVSPVLSAADLLPADVLAGPHHRVRDAVHTDGYQARYVIDSDFGTFPCASAEQVIERVAEIGALGRLAELSKSEVFVDALKQSAEKPVEAVKNIAADPGGSLKKLPSTVGHFFRRAGTAVVKGAQKVGETISEGGTGSGAELEAAGKGAIGFNRALLEMARRLEVDPYTDNQVLKDRMEETAWVFYAGGLPLNLGVAAASGGASLALRTTKMAGLPEDVYDLTPSEISLRNRDALAAMGVDEAGRDAFLENPAFTPTIGLSIIDSLNRLAGVRGRPAVVALATGTGDRFQARFLEAALRLLADRHASGAARYGELVVLGRLPGGVKADGSLDVPAPIDFASWTEEVADFAHRPDLVERHPTLVLRGTRLSEMAAGGLAEAGWTIVGQAK